MTTGEAAPRGGGGQGWRILGWGFAGGLLLLPLVAMQFTDEVQWTGSDFVFAGVVIGSVGVAAELAVRRSRNLAYRAGAGIALLAAFLLVWINAAVGIVGDDNPLNLLYGVVLIVALAGGIGAGFRAAGMVRAMQAAAVAQGLVALIAFLAAPNEPPGQVPILGLNLVFLAMFAASAALFARAAQAEG